MTQLIYRWRYGGFVQDLIERAYCESHGYGHWAGGTVSHFDSPSDSNCNAN